MQEMIGVKTTLVSAGRFKTELSPFAPLSDEARSAIQAKVDTFYGMFVADVAAGRGVSEQAVRDGFGQGRMVTAAAAAEAGMVDRVDTFDATVQRLLEQRPSRSRRSAVAATDDSAATLAEQSDAVRVAAADLLKRTRSLAEFRDRGRLGASKREHLTACTEELRDVVAALAGVLAETDPVKQHTDVLREAARFERGRTATL